MASPPIECIFPIASPQKSELGSPAEFLSAALDPPSRANVSRAMSVLREIGALRPGDPATLAPLGLHLAALPVDVRLGKMLVFGAILGCLQPVVSSICARSSDEWF